MYLGRLSFHTREKDIEHFFKNIGHLKEVVLKRGYGFVVCGLSLN